ncbi:MAG TPA: NAD(P)-dependent oxidoreductase [Polyangiales bacterium]|nr:NAD(P)-dependent oxidoreductase [Polyangiales bacterium]
MDYFPLFMHVQGAECLVVGGGEVAARKAATLLRAGALVHVVAPELAQGMQDVLHEASAKHSARGYRTSDLDRVWLVIAATDDRELNARVSRDARERRVPVNVVDDPELCTFIMPAIVDRSPLVVAISSTGASPVLARLARGKLEAALPARYGPLARLCSALRSEVRERLPDLQQRRRFWETALEGTVAELVFAGRDADAEQALRQLLVEFEHAPPPRGEVFLVGVGPNDPELVSFRALRAMERADLVLASARVSEAILDLCRRDAARERFVDFSPEVMPLVALRASAAARAGSRVCVLGVGDAFRSSTGDELRARLTAAGLHSQLVPGVA